ncbi:MAG: hydrogenase formation protein HypD [Thermoprotei archaeon]|nr:MAG: hydrogenase formation protein HypD [Thermoprotei archaeon]
MSLKNLFLRDKRVALEIASDIKKIAEKIGGEIKIMHVCGTHEHTVTYYGLRSLLPENVKVIAGPGCPVCVVPAKEIDEAIKLAMEGIKVYTYGDMYRVPGSRKSLADAKAEGGEVQVVYSVGDAVKLAKSEKREAVFFSVGFETTAPIPAAYICSRNIPENMTFLVSHRLTVPALKYVLDDPEIPLNGVIAPGHVSAIMGASSWSFVAEEYGIPVVVAGFEPIDFLMAVDIILRQIYRGEAKIINEYTRVVKWEGNLNAKKLMYKAFKAVDGEWRGIGVLPRSVFTLTRDYKIYDARERYDIRVDEVVDFPPPCRCADVILGKAVPTDCPMFLKACTLSRPYGPCMVSSEGTCSIWAKYGGYSVVKRSNG